jgi:adenine deaminase
MMTMETHKIESEVRRIRELVQAARGDRPCDLVVRGGSVINVFTGEIIRADVGILGEQIAVVTGDGTIDATQTIDANGLFLSPGLIDAHIHLESTMLTPAEFARFVLPRGTTAVVTDPHELANVAGKEGIRELITASENLPVRFYVMIPSCVPASEFETSAARLDVTDISELSREPAVIGLGEMMDFNAVLSGSEEALRKLASARDKVVDGHCPGLSGRELQAYVAAGIDSEHQATDFREWLEKLRAGMHLMIREGSAAKDFDKLIDLIKPQTVDRCMLVSDDLLAVDLEELGHMDQLLRHAVRHGIDAVQALRMATVNPAKRFGLRRIGAVAPGYNADIVAFKDLSDFEAAFVIAKGKPVASDGQVIVELHEHSFGDALLNTVHLPDLTAEKLEIPASEGLANVIQAADGRIITGRLLIEPTVLSGLVISDVERDILKIVVVERHGMNGNITLGLVNGFGLKSGAFASSVAHDAHNVVAVGTKDLDILCAIQRVGEMNGGLAVADEGRIIADLPLPIAGLISTSKAGKTTAQFRRLEDAVRRIGSQMKHPFMTLSFMCLSVIQELKITDRGLVDVGGSRIIPLFTGTKAEAEHTAVG